MAVNDLDPSKFVDIFGPGKPTDSLNTPTEPQKQQVPEFGNPDEIVTLGNVDIFKPKAATEEPAKAAEPVTDENGEIKKEEKKDVDILNTGGEGDDKGKPGRKAKYDFSDASGYFADRFKSGKLVAMTETLEDGTERDFIPKTPEEFDEVIDTQVNYRISQKEKELENSWYESKSPAWKAIAKYAELTDNPAEVVPFIQGIRNIESLSEVDENTPEGAETIVRSRLAQRGDTEDIINDHIDTLKAQDKLISTAAKYKPLILEQERSSLEQMARQKQAADARYKQMVTEIRDTAVKVIQQPLLGNIKLTQQQMASAYDLIGEPTQEQGYGIFTAIDNLYETRDFETLRLLALVIADKQTVISAIQNAAADKTSQTVQRKISIATDNKRAGGDVNLGNDVVRVKREQYSNTPKFGRI